MDPELRVWQVGWFGGWFMFVVGLVDLSSSEGLESLRGMAIMLTAWTLMVVVMGIATAWSYFARRPLEMWRLVVTALGGLAMGSAGISAMVEDKSMADGLGWTIGMVLLPLAIAAFAVAAGLQRAAMRRGDQNVPWRG